MNKQSDPLDTNSQSLIDDYDSPWKDAVEHYFPEFIAFYFPDAYAQIDWTISYEFLEQELQSLSLDAELGKRFVDKLVKVTLFNRDEKWIYIHIEVQGTQQSGFAERMFVYNYRIYDHYRRPVASMAVLADEQTNWKPNSYGFEVLGCRHHLEFPIAKLTDYHDSLDALLVEDNSFAFITAAHILTQRTRKNHQERYTAKHHLVRLLYQRRWDKQRVLDLFNVMDWLMRLPEELAKQLHQEIEVIEEAEKMRYLNSVEKIILENQRKDAWGQGLEQGLEQGIKKGHQEGLLAGEAKLLKKLLERKFGNLPAWINDKVSTATQQDLERWGEAVLTMPTLDSIFNDNSMH